MTNTPFADPTVGVGRLHAVGHKTNQPKTTIEWWPLFRQWAPKFVNEFGGGNFSHIDDVVSLCAERTFVLHETDRPTHVLDWTSYVHASCRSHVATYFESGAVTVASGMSGVVRRQRRIGKQRSALTAVTGREPSRREIIEAINSDASVTRSDARRQGALVSESDFSLPTATVDIETLEWIPAGQSIGTGTISRVEALELADMIIEECHSISDEMGQAAMAWLGQAFAEPPVFGTVTEVSGHLDVPMPKASRLMKRVREVARRVCVDDFGIESPFSA